MSECVDWIDGKTCRQCGKQFSVLYPHMWRYKRLRYSGMYHWFCSWGCLRAYDKKMEETKQMRLTAEQRQHAVDLVLAGQHPGEYIESLGIQNPMTSWHYIKKQLKQKDPETWAKLPDNLGKLRHVETPEGDWTPAVKVYGPVKIETPEPEQIEVVKSAGECMKDMQDAADEFFGKCKDMGLKLDKEPEESEFECSVIRSKKTGARYEMFDGSLCLKIGSDEFVLSLDGWRALMKEIPQAAKKLGVEL